MDRARNSRAGRRPALRGRLRRWLRPPRTLRPTRAGWIFFVLTLGVGFAALNTGNNLLYLVLSLMLAFLVLSGVLSESALRGIGVTRHLPSEIFEGTPALIALEIRNAQRRVPAFAVALEDRVREPGAPERAAGRGFVLRIGAGECEERFYRFEASHRGPVVFTGFRVSTRFPFGLFMKSLLVPVRASALVYPSIHAAPVPQLDGLDPRPGEASTGRSGPGSEVGGLRDFASGDSARHIEWRASLRTGSLVVRNTEREERQEVEVRLTTRAQAGEAFEQAVRAAASSLVAGLDAGLRVALRTDEAFLPAGAGRRQRLRLLTYLARVQPGAASEASG